MWVTVVIMEKAKKAKKRIKAKKKMIEKQ